MGINGVSIVRDISNMHTAQIGTAGANLTASELSVTDEISTIIANERSRLAFNSFQSNFGSVGGRLMRSATQIRNISNGFAGLDRDGAAHFSQGFGGHTIL